MAASDNLSTKQFSVYRGLQTPGTQINRDSLGVHWTDVPKVAHDFAKGEGLGDYSLHRSSYKGPSSVIHATAEPSAVHPMKNEEDFEEYGIAADQDEAEVPLKRGAKVKVHSVTTYRGEDREKSRTRTYKKPREMKA
jgi:hypothetical protein